MRAVVCEKYGPPEVLKIREVPRPIPGKGEILIKIRAATVTAGDVRIRRFNVPFWQWLPSRLYLGIQRPRRKIPGMELSGEVEAVGETVSRFQPGDTVFAFAGFGFGAYAEYICLPEEGSVSRGLVAPKPEGIGWGEAAAATGGALTALKYLRVGEIQRRKKVLICGASGSVGTFAVQLARYFGAEVTGVCSTGNRELVKSLGAERVIDYTREDFVQRSDRYDLVFDAVAKYPRARARKVLEKNGRFLSSHDSHGSPKLTAADLEFIGTLLGARKIKSVIDRRYSLDQIVDAHRYVEQGHKKGNVVIMVEAAES